MVVKRRLGLLRDRPASDAGRAALGTLVEELRPLARGREGPAPPGRSAPRRRVVAIAPRRRCQPRARRENRDVPARRARRQVDRLRVVPRRRCALRPARYCAGLRAERLAEGGRLTATRQAHAEYFARLADAAWAELRGRDWQTWVSRLELEHDNLWAALTYARDAHDAGIAARLASLAWYFSLAERVTEGRRFVELALAEASDDIPSDRQLGRTAWRSLLSRDRRARPRRRDRDRRARARNRIDPVGRAASRSRAGDARACGRPCRRRRARRIGRAGACHVKAGPDHWAFAVASLLRAHIAAAVGDASRSRPWRRTRTATPRRSGSTPSASRRRCSMRGSPSGRTTARPPRTRTVAHSSSRVAQASRTASRSPCPTRFLRLARGDLRHAEELQRRALATAEGACSLGRRPCARRARPHPRRGRRHRDRREAVPERPRVVADAAPARATREPLPRAGRKTRPRPRRPAWPTSATAVL